jgi:uncharacterized integral membrane protein
MTHRAFAEYKDKPCGDKNIKCTEYSGWSNTGIVINLIIYSILLIGIIGLLILLIKQLSNGKSAKLSTTEKIQLFAYPSSIIIIIVIIIGQSLLINQDKLSCDSSYVCLNSDSKTNTNNGTIKFSAVLSIILSCLILIASLIFLSQN